MFWKFELPLLSRAEVFGRIKHFWWGILQIWTATIIMSWNLRKNKAILIRYFANLNCHYYYKLKFSEEQSNFDQVFCKFELPLLSRAEIFGRIKQFWSGVLKIWTAPIITSWNFLKTKRFCWSVLKIWTIPCTTSRNFLKNKAVLLKCFENLTCPYDHELKFSQNKVVLLKWFENLNFNFYQELTFSQK